MFNFLKKLIKYTIVYPLVAIFAYSAFMTAYGWNDPERVAAREARELAKIEAEIDKQIEEAAEKAREAERVAQAEAQKKLKGFHCLSSWDGSHTNLKRLVERNMRNPDSFDHVETRITPVNASLEHTVIMTYRGQNGFGGMSVETVKAVIDNSNCSIKRIL